MISIISKKSLENQIICNDIQAGISLYKHEWETVIRNCITTCSSGLNYYYWFSYDWIKKIVSMKPIDHL